MQIEQFQDEQGCLLPCVIKVPGGARMQLGTLAAFTGKGFLRTVADQCTDGSQGATLTAAFGDAEVGAAACLFAIMRGSAPCELSIADLRALLVVCNFAMAGRLLSGISNLLLPWLRASAHQVPPPPQACSSVRAYRERRVC